MKKKILALCLVVVLAITAVTGATLAYFTDTDEAVNTFVMGNVKIRQDEHQRNKDTKAIEDFADDKNVKPAVMGKLTKKPITVDGYTFDIRDLAGNYVDKIVNVVNEGTEPAYVRTIIAIPSLNGYDDAEDPTFNPLHWNYLDATDFKGTGWDWNGLNDAEATKQKCYVEEVVIKGVEYDIYVATHNQAVEAGKTTSPSMVGFYLHDTVGCDEDGYFYVNENKQKISLAEWMQPNADGIVTMNILVATQACQTDGFADAWEALDAAFGEVDATNAKTLFEAVITNDGK